MLKEIAKLANQYNKAPNLKKEPATFEEHQELALTLLNISWTTVSNAEDSEAMDMLYTSLATKEMNFTEKIKEKIIENIFTTNIWKFSDYETEENLDEGMEFCELFIRNIEENINKIVCSNIMWDLNALYTNERQPTKIIDKKENEITILTPDKRKIIIKNKKQIQEILKEE